MRQLIDAWGRPLLERTRVLRQRAHNNSKFLPRGAQDRVLRSLVVEPFARAARAGDAIPVRRQRNDRPSIATVAGSIFKAVHFPHIFLNAFVQLSLGLYNLALAFSFAGRFAKWERAVRVHYSINVLY